MDSQTELRRLLRNLESLAYLDEDSLLLVMGQMTSASFKAGQTICTQGDEGDCMHIVSSGTVKVSRRADDGTQVEIAKLGRGEFVGEMSLFDDSPRSATVEADSDVELWCLERDRFLCVLEDYPAVARAVMSSLSERLRKATHTIATLRAAAGDEPSE